MIPLYPSVSQAFRLQPVTFGNPGRLDAPRCHGMPRTNDSCNGIGIEFMQMILKTLEVETSVVIVILCYLYVIDYSKYMMLPSGYVVYIVHVCAR